MTDRINDIDEFVQRAIGGDSEQVRNMFYNNCSNRLQAEILELAPPESKDHLQAACRILGNWNNAPSLQNFV